MENWYRRKTWTKGDEEQFFLKLNRANKDKRAQYLRIQAFELSETKDDKLLDVAESLIQKLIIDYPDNKFDMSLALNILGNIYRYQEKYSIAVVYYKKAIDFERIFPKILTQAYLDFSELVVKLKLSDQYDFAEEITSERIKGSIFPIEKYKAFSILSIIHRFKGNVEQAREFAILAEQNATAETSGLRYDRFLGVVTKRDDWLDKLSKLK